MAGVSSLHPSPFPLCSANGVWETEYLDAPPKNKMPDKKIWGSSARTWSRQEVPRTSNLHGGDHSSKGQGSLGGA